MNKKIVLAYSGGLDTSVILKWLLLKGYEVVCFIADVGQKDDFAAAKQKALAIGASKVVITDLKEEFVKDYIFQALKANAMYEGRYLLGTALARPLIAKKQIEVTQAEGCCAVAHGATGKGNDQVRFEITYLKWMPQVEIIAPWKDPEFLNQFQGRTDLIAYAEKHHIPITSTLAKPYSMDENLMHISYEGGLLENPAQAPQESMFQNTKTLDSTPEKPDHISIEFLQGVPIKVINHTDHQIATGSNAALLTYLNQLGCKHGIGRIDMVENRFVGMKSRGIYETPGGTILWKAHIDLEALVLDREVFHLKEQWMPKIAQLIYNGFWFAPEMEFLMAAVNQSQANVEGIVHMTLHKGHAYATGRESTHSLYQENIASMDCKGNYDPCDANGFIHLQALRLRKSS